MDYLLSNIAIFMIGRLVASFSHRTWEIAVLVALSYLLGVFVGIGH